MGLISRGDLLRRFGRGNLSVPSSGVLNMRPIRSGNLLRRFGRGNLSLTMVLLECPETSVINHHYSLRNNTEERWSHVLRGGRLKSPVPLPLQVYCGPKTVHLFLSTPRDERSGTAGLKSVL